MTYEGYTIVNVSDFISPTYKLLGKSNKKKRIYDCESILDIETSHNHILENLKPWVYQWAWLLNDIIVVGREREEIYEVQRKLEETNQDGYFRTFVHNLPYEFSYLWKGWDENFGQTSEIMATNPHKVFRCEYGRMEFLCSYKMSNRSLSAWGKYYDVEHKKLDNAIDYDAIHYPSTILTDTDWLYMYHDVICPRECIHALMKQEGMRYDQLLMTSTMYVKNEVTKEYKKDKENYKEFKRCRLNAKAYIILRRAFVGGITHANWKMLNTTVKGDIQHYDFDSHYPTQMITKLFPMGKVSHIYMETDLDLSEFSVNNNYAYWVEVVFHGLHLRSSEITMPYISASKCYGIGKCIKDNGRLVSTDSDFIMYLSSYDIKWILKQYTTESYEIINVYRSKLGKLPQYLRDVIMKCYTTKSNLKKKLATMDSTTEEYRTLNSEYMKSKNVLNGLYGVCATDPVRDDVTFNNGIWCTLKKHNTLDEIQELLDKYYNNHNRWTRYEWGGWVTSLARDELMRCIEIVGYDNFLYCDTDSIFFLSTDEIIEKITELNNEWLEDAKTNEYCVDVNGKPKYMHKFDAEEPLTQFRTLGAKCYAFVDKDNKFDCTIAGVPSRKTYLINDKEVTYTRAEELGNIDNLTIGFTFNKCVPTRAVYTDDGCVILNSEHKLSLCESNADVYFEEYIS